MFSYLQSPRVNLQLLQEAYCRQLVHLLEKIEGPKTILLDEALWGPIKLVTAPSFFTDRSIKLLKLEPGARLPRDFTNIIFIVRPQIAFMDEIASIVKKHSDKTRLFYLFFVKRKSCLCMKHLEDKDVLNSFEKIDELTWNFFPLDADLVSMELPQAYHDVAIDCDPTALYQAALGLMQLQRLYGRIPKIYGKGNHSQRVWEHAKQLGVEEKSLLNGDKGAIDQLIILDRSIDILSALATQLTYEGLIDEFYGINQNKLSMPAELFVAKPDEAGGSQAQAQLSDENKVFLLNSADNLFAELRDKNFNEVGRTLARHAKEISAQMGAKTETKSLDDMKQFVANQLPQLLQLKKSVAVHTTIAEVIRKKLDAPAFTDDLAAEQEFMVCEDIDKPSSYIENLIAKKSDLRNVLRLMCIQCAAGSGLKEKTLNYYKRELAQVYGIEVLLTLSNLEKAGLLHTQSESRAYAVLRKTLNLTVDNVVEIDPTDISYVHSFYAPLTARIVEQTLKPLGWQSLKSQINNLAGQTFEDFQAQLIGIGGRQSSTPSEGFSLNIPRVILVFFVGGCTFAEIAALRFLSQQEDNNVEFVIATTKVINKHNFLDSLM